MFIVLIWQQISTKSVSKTSALFSVLVISCICTVILTSNLRPDWLWQSRPYLLIFVDAMPFIIWACGVLTLTDHQHQFSLNRWAKIALTLYISWHVYFFAILHAKGWFHEVSHWLGAIAVSHLMYLAISQWRDDLVNQRRTYRVIFVIGATLVLAIYVISELSGTLFMRTPIGSLVGAMTFLLFSTVIATYWFTASHRVPKSEPVELEPNPEPKSLPLQYQSLYQDLTDFMDNQGFTESNLTVTTLAHRLNTQEHRLRALINQHLGFRNFSSYLNEFRLPFASEQLMANATTSITAIAYDSGFGSITSFNRAFKLKYQLSPTDYRNKVQNPGNDLGS